MLVNDPVGGGIQKILVEDGEEVVLGFAESYTYTVTVIEKARVDMILEEECKEHQHGLTYIISLEQIEL